MEGFKGLVTRALDEELDRGLANMESGGLQWRGPPETRDGGRGCEKQTLGGQQENMGGRGGGRDGPL